MYKVNCNAGSVYIVQRYAYKFRHNFMTLENQSILLPRNVRYLSLDFHHHHHSHYHHHCCSVVASYISYNIFLFCYYRGVQGPTASISITETTPRAEPCRETSHATVARVADNTGIYARYLVVINTWVQIKILMIPSLADCENHYENEAMKLQVISCTGETPELIFNYYYYFTIFL